MSLCQGNPFRGIRLFGKSTIFVKAFYWRAVLLLLKRSLQDSVVPLGFDSCIYALWFNLIPFYTLLLGMRAACSTNCPTGISYFIFFDVFFFILFVD